MEKYKKAIEKFPSIQDVFQNRYEVKVVQNKNKKEEIINIENLVPMSLYIFSLQNWFRKLVIKIVLHKAFDISVTVLIILNSLFLGINDYNEDNENTWRNDLNNYSEPVFTALFTLELTLKVIAFGFIRGENTYLKDKWNWIDFIVVITSILSTFPQFGNYSAFRTFRLLRPLRSLNSLQNMKLLVATLLSSLSQLGEIVVFAMFFFLIFAIMGVSLWAGRIHFRCRETEFPVNGDWVPVESDTEL